MLLEKKSTQWALLIFLAFIWGSSFILMKKGLIAFSDIQVASMRIVLTFLFFLPFALMRIKEINRKNILSLLIVGFIGNFLPAFLYTKAQTQIDSSLAGVLSSLTPLFTLVIGLVMYKSRVKMVNIIGLVLGFIGALGLIFGDPAASVVGVGTDVSGEAGLVGGAGPTSSAFLIVLATLFYGISVNEIKYKLADMDALSIASLSFFIIGPFAGIKLLFSDMGEAIRHPEVINSLLFIGLLAFFGSFVAVLYFNMLIKHTTAIFASSVTYIIPVFAMIWGFFDGESITINEIMWILVILIGVYLVNKQKLVEI